MMTPFFKKVLIIGILSLLFVVGASVAGYLFVTDPSFFGLSHGKILDSSNPTSSFEEATKRSSALLTTDSRIADAETAVRAGKYADAANLLEAVLADSSLSADKVGSLTFRLAQIYTSAGEYGKAVNLFKSIAADVGTYNAEFRANALQEMAHMNDWYGPSVGTYIFNTEPYASMARGQSTGVAFRRLYEYAADTYPLGLSELYIAEWYASRLYATSTAARDGALAQDYKKNVRVRYELASKDIERMEADPTVQRTTSLTYTLFHILEEQAVVAGYMRLIGDSSLDDPEQLFKALLARYERLGLATDWTVRIQYAYFLTRKSGVSRIDDIRALLLPLIENPTGHGSTLKKSLAGIRFQKSSISSSKRVNQQMAALVPEYKALLVSLGWTTSDFVIGGTKTSTP